ncbi:MAG: hypothetical protein RBU45_21925 [Myxococcota bacterium]|jgi:hypothetical protein|nr:hypothetical protein [Myxococcota bacterium]
MSALQQPKGAARTGRTLSSEARLVARETMHQRGVFNRYLRLVSTAAAPQELRAEFLSILPGYARRNGLDRRILLDVGVPKADLDEVAFLD